MKKVVKGFFVLIIVAFFALYFSYKNGYYERKNAEKRFLTDMKIKEYEEDLANGVDVSKKDYVVILPSYDNTYTRTSLKVSNKIEKIIDGTIKYFFKKISKMVEE